MPSGASSVVSIAPATIFASEVLRPVVEQVVSTERLEAFRARHGVDLRSLERLVIATYEPTGPEHETTLYLARGPFHAQVVVAEIGNRMSPLESRDSHPLERRAGVYRMRRMELLALGPTSVALHDGPPALSGRLVAAVHAPRGELDVQAPLVLMHHGRPDLPLTGLGILLARLEHTMVSLDARGSQLRIHAALDGEFPPGAEENFRALVTSLAQSDLGQALGMREVERTLVVQASPTSVTLEASVNPGTVAAGLRALVGAEMDELLEVP